MESKNCSKCSKREGKDIYKPAEKFIEHCKKNNIQISVLIPIPKGLVGQE